MPPRNKISQLPPELRATIDRMLIDAGFSGYDMLEQMILNAHGIAIGKSSLHRYGQKLERRLSAIRASTEAARAIAEAAPDEADHRSAAVISLVQSSLFDAMLALEEADEEADPADRVKLLANAARAIAEASRASQGQKKWESEIQAKANIAAADKAAAVAKRNGMSKQTIDAIKAEILGIRT
ncbi:MAG: phage protein Gp27 family protein [Halothiobacillus sp.]